MDKVIEGIKNKLSGFGVSAVIDILILTILVYFLFFMLKKYNAKNLIYFVTAFVVIGIICVIFSARVGSVIFKLLLPICYILLVLIFHNEIKRDIWRISLKKQGFYGQSLDITQEESRRTVQEIVKAMQTMAKNDVGALIVISKDNLPNHIIESGTMLNATLSSELIESIFNTKSPLHDGTIVVTGNKIIAAGCFLPLSQEINISKELGTRHRAGLGISETSNVLALIVSEETGIISYAEGGKVTRYVDSSMLTKKLEEVYGLDIETSNSHKNTRRHKQ